MMSKKKKICFVLDFIFLAMLIAFDQFTKYLAVIKLKDKAAFDVIPNVLELNYLENRGAAFGMLKNQKFFFVFVAIIIICLIVYFLYKVPDTKKYDILHLLLVMIAAGAIGNMIDRIRLEYVVDFIYAVIIQFPIFNVADIYVTVATFFLVILLLFVYKEDDLNFLSFKQNKIREIK
ncbi:MAG: signal peptidase II [Lachnospiraceae bacterium]|nr:signal peptidase II [Lachnospiraceae bacterium]